MLRVGVDQRQRLDLSPRSAPLAPTLERLESWQYPAAGRRRRLYGWGDELLYLSGDGVGAVEPAGPGVYHRLGVESLGASLRGGPLVVSDDDELLQWDQGALTAYGGSSWLGTAATRLDDDLVLARRFDEPATELIDLRTTRALWRREGYGLTVVPFGDRLIEMDGQDDTAVHAWDTTTGSLEWTWHAHGRVDRLVAVVEDRIWLALGDELLASLDLETGRPRESRRVPDLNVLPLTVTAAGHVVTGSGEGLRILDLTTDGSILDDHRFADPWPGSIAFVRVAADDRILFIDDYRRIWVVEPGAPQHPHLVGTADALITGLEIGHERLYALTENGLLTTYGSSRTSPSPC
jgi:hypothetical protein